MAAARWRRSAGSPCRCYGGCAAMRGRTRRRRCLPRRVRHNAFGGANRGRAQVGDTGGDTRRLLVDSAHWQRQPRMVRRRQWWRRQHATSGVRLAESPSPCRSSSETGPIRLDDDWWPEAGARGCGLEVGGAKLEARSWRLEVGGSKLEAQSWRLDVGGSMAGGSMQLEARSWRSVV